MGKGEIARYEQFLLFPQCFQQACFPGASKGVIVWEWVNVHCSVQRSVLSILVFLTLSQTTNFGRFQLKEFADHNFIENTVGKGEIARY